MIIMLRIENWPSKFKVSFQENKQLPTANYYKHISINNHCNNPEVYQSQCTYLTPKIKPSKKLKGGGVGTEIISRNAWGYPVPPPEISRYRGWVCHYQLAHFDTSE